MQCRYENRAKAEQLVKEGKVSEATTFFQKCVDITPAMAKKVIDQLKYLGSFLGVLQLAPQDWEFSDKEAWTSKSVLPQYTQFSDGDIETMIDERRHARMNKEWKRSDEIRDALAAHGVILEDRADGTTRWKR